MSHLRYLTDSDRIAVHFTGGTYSYHQLIWASQCYGALLPGVPGDRVALVAENSPQWYCSFYSIWHRRMIPVPVDAQSTAEEIRHVLDDCTPSAIWVTEKTEPRVREALRGCTKCQAAVLRMDCQQVPPAPSEALDHGEFSPDEIGVIIYTSGTTGTPKGAMLSFGNLQSNIDAVTIKTAYFNPDDRIIVILPLHHILPLQGTMLVPLSIGAQVVLIPKLDGAAIMATMAQYRITFIIGVPRLYETILDGIKAKMRSSILARMLFAFSSLIGSRRLGHRLFQVIHKRMGGALRYCICGGAALPPQVGRGMTALGFELMNGYGMSETSPIIAAPPPNMNPAGSVGVPIACNQVLLQDGEITVKGSNVMQGYYNRPQETAAMFDADGWMHTGDLGYIDRRGRLHVTGRKKEIIVLDNGKNINPVEIEEKLMKMADGMISECAVTPGRNGLAVLIVPDMAQMRRRHIVNIQESLIDQLIEPYNVSAVSYKRLLQCVFVAEPLPRTRLGKIRRHELPALLNGEKQRHGITPELDDADRATAALDSYKLLEEYLRQQQPEVQILPSSHFELDLGVDSLGKVAMISYLNECYGRNFPDAILAEYPTAGQLAQYLQQFEANGRAVAGDASCEEWIGGLVEQSQCRNAAIPRISLGHGPLLSITSGMLKMVSHVSFAGQANIPDGACILAPNHSSLLDSFYVAAGMNRDDRRRTCYFATAKFAERPVLRFLARRHNVISMDINGNLGASIQSVAATLQTDRKVVIFPEGTRSIDGALGELKPTFAMLSAKLNVPVVPVKISGASQVMPRGAILPRPGHAVTVEFMTPIQPAQCNGWQEILERTRKALS